MSKLSHLLPGAAGAAGTSHVARWAPILVVLTMMLLLSGCIIQPLAAGEGGMPVVVSNGEPVIAIAPVAAASGTTVSVAGAGWIPNEVVYVNLEGERDGQQLASTVAVLTTDGDGRFNAVFVAPLDLFWQDATGMAVVARSQTTGASAAAVFAFAPGTGTPTAVLTTTTPAATPTPLPRPSAEPSAEPSAGLARVTSRGLNMRAGPSVYYPVVRVLTYNTELAVLGQDRSGFWLYGALSDRTVGWVARAYTDFRGTAPILPAPPMPSPQPTPPRPTPVPTGAPVGWLGEYYANRFLSGAPVLVREDPAVNFDWGYGSPAPNLPPDNFSVRWTTNLFFPEGWYRFNARADDGIRLWVDGRLVIDEWHDYVNTLYAADLWLSNGNHTLVVDYYEHTQYAFVQLWWERISPTPSPGFPEWRGEYFANRHLEGAPAFVRNDYAIDFNWGTSSPAPGIPNTNYSVRWTRTVEFESGDYRLYARTDDGVRVFVDDRLVIDEWYDQSGNVTHTAELYLSGHQRLRVEYYQHTGGAMAYFWWERIHSPKPTKTPTRTPTPAAAGPFADANPASGPAGSWVTVNFGGFPAYEWVNLYLGGVVSTARAAENTVYASAQADQNGGGALSFTMPDRWPDGAPIQPGELTLLVATGDFRFSASAPFEFRRARPTVAANPYLDAEPGSGGPGTSVAVRGGGFPANQTINLYLGGVAQESLSAAAAPQQVANTRADGNGNFATTFAMPRTWPDGQTIPNGKLVILAATADFGVEATDTFNFFVNRPKPSVSINPAAGGAGTMVTASGSGFPSEMEVGVYLSTLDAQVGGGTPYRFAVTMTDYNGRYSVSFAMPAFWPDGSPVAQDRLVVTVANQDGSIAASAVFRYALPGPTPTPTRTALPTNTPAVPPTPTRSPSARVAPRGGGAGTYVTVDGGGFPANAVLYAHLAPLDDSTGSGMEYAQYASTLSDGNGNYALALTMPERWPDGSYITTGRLVILVATDDMRVQAGASFDYRGVISAGEGGKPTATAEPPAPEPPTATPEPPAPVEPPTATPEPPAPVEPPTATPEPPAPVDPPTATPEPPAPVEPPTATPEPPAPVEPPTATPEPPTPAPGKIEPTPTSDAAAETVAGT